MSKTPRLSAKEIIAALGRAGFVLSRIKGSHHFLKHPDGRKTVVPLHSGETIGFRNVIVRWPKRRLTVVVLSNRDDPEPYRTALAIGRLYF